MMKIYPAAERVRHIIIFFVLLSAGIVLLLVVEGGPALIGLGAGFMAAAGSGLTTIRYRAKINRWMYEDTNHAGNHSEIIKGK